MARPLRLEIPGSVYFVLCRGCNHKTIFRDNADCEKFLEILSQVKNKFSIRLYAFCLVRNQYQLLIETPIPNLGRTMQFLNSVYAAYFKGKSELSGQILQNHYQAVLVEKGSPLLRMTRYIHLSPVRAGMTKDPAKYAWSSYECYVTGNNKVSFLECDEVLKVSKGSEKTARKRYEKYVTEDMNDKLLDDPLEEVSHQFLLGGNEFVKEMKKKLSEYSDQGKDRFSNVMTRDPEEIAQRILRENLDEPLRKKLMAYFLNRYTTLTLKEIDQRAGGGGHESRISQIVRRFENRLKDTPSLKKLVDHLSEEMGISGA